MVKCKFFTSPIDPFVTWCVSDIQNCGKMQIVHVAEERFRHFVRVGHSKLWYGKLDVFARTGPDYGGLCSTGIVLEQYFVEQSSRSSTF